MPKKVFVGLSGGVDSAVSAALLKERGYDVVGAFIKIWQPEFTECTWREDRLDAMRVAAALDIPLEEVDLSEEYKREVVSKMVDDYARGITPNPDVLCNRAIKFGHFAKWAQSRGAECIATGHYARIEKVDGTFGLLRGVDAAKDQSYFLYRLTEADLATTLFPVGEHAKTEIRKLARRFGLPVADKRDSQGLCFVGDVSLPAFLSRYIRLKKGHVVMDGAVVGEHDGAALYTIGQRHGFISKSEEPLFVVRIDVAANTLTVSPERTKAARKGVNLEDVHWIGKPPKESFEVQAQARYREAVVDAVVTPRGGKAHVKFAVPHIAAPGQSLVLYRGDECLGGGIITAD